MTMCSPATRRPREPLHGPGRRHDQRSHPVARLQVFGPDRAGQSVWSLTWQGNGMDADAALAQTDALVVGRCPLMVWPDENGMPRITIEDAKSCRVRYVS